MSEEKVQKRPATTGGGEDAAALIAEYRSAHRYHRVASFLVVIAILGVVLTLAYRGYSYVRKVAREVTVPERLSVLQKRVETSWSDLQPKVAEQWKSTWPELRELARQKAEAARPELEQVARTQAETFRKNLEDMLNKKAEALVQRIIEENKDTLQKDYPDLMDPVKMTNLVELLVSATQKAAITVFSPRTKEHEKVLSDIDAWRTKLPLMEAGKSTTDLLWRLGEVSWDLLVVKTSAPAPAAPEAVAPGAKPAPAPAAPAPVAAPAPAPTPAPAPAPAPAR